MGVSHAHQRAALLWLKSAGSSITQSFTINPGRTNFNDLTAAVRLVNRRFFYGYQLGNSLWPDWSAARGSQPVMSYCDVTVVAMVGFNK